MTLTLQKLTVNFGTDAEHSAKFHENEASDLRNHCCCHVNELTDQQTDRLQYLLVMTGKGNQTKQNTNRL